MELPESTVPRPRTPPFAALMERIGVSQADIEAARETPAELEAFMAHSAFESMRDAEGNTRYPEPTDCEGVLRVTDDSQPIWVVRCDACGFEVGVSLRKVAPERATERLLDQANIPPLFRGKAFDSEEPAQKDTLGACRIWIRQFKAHKLSENLPAIALYGRAGRGKSHLLSLIVETLIRNYGVPAVYLPAGELFSEMRAAMDRGGMDLEWQRIVRIPVLALDDLGSMRSTPWRLELLQALLDHRINAGLPLLIATNLPPAAWEREFGDRQSSRMRGMMLPLLLDGRDRRDLAQQSFGVGDGGG